MLLKALALALVTLHVLEQKLFWRSKGPKSVLLWVLPIDYRFTRRFHARPKEHVMILADKMFKWIRELGEK